MTRAKILAVAVGLCTLVGPVPANAAPQPPRNFDTIGYFPSQNDCQWVGATGRSQRQWAGFYCDRAGGAYRGLWQLTVQRYGATRFPGGPMGNPGRPDWPPRGPRHP
jgi:hypothetical protein